uniref:Uncharacterized protein n=1 Tax=Rhizophora mucronata TaxID=61149 RepID=A0A2P2Q381_RHIMU
MGILRLEFEDLKFKLILVVMNACDGTWDLRTLRGNRKGHV